MVNQSLRRELMQQRGNISIGIASEAGTLLVFVQSVPAPRSSSTGIIDANLAYVAPRGNSRVADIIYGVKKRARVMRDGATKKILKRLPFLQRRRNKGCVFEMRNKYYHAAFLNGIIFAGQNYMYKDLSRIAYVLDI